MFKPQLSQNFSYKLIKVVYENIVQNQKVHTIGSKLKAFASPFNKLIYVKLKHFYCLCFSNDRQSLDNHFYTKIAAMVICGSSYTNSKKWLNFCFHISLKELSKRICMSY